MARKQVVAAKTMALVRSPQAWAPPSQAGGATEAARGLQSDHLLDPALRLLAGLDAGRVLAGPGAGRRNVGGCRGMNAASQWSAAQGSALIDWSSRCCSPAFRSRAITDDGHRKAINGRV